MWLRRTRKRAEQAGIVFPVSRLYRYMKNCRHFFKRRIIGDAAVYEAGVIDYLTKEVLDIAGDIATKDKKKTINPRHIMLAVYSDSDLHETLRKVTFPFSGVSLQINKELLKKPLKSASLGAASKLKENHDPKYGEVHTVKQPSQAILSERFMNTTNIVVIQGDLTTMKTDVIVHPSDASMSFNGMVGTALMAKCGSQLLAAVNDSLVSGNLGYLDVRKTPSFNINAPWILHCNGPTYSNDRDAQDLAKLINTCLEVCETEKFSSIAFPSVGSGRAHFPCQLAAETILRTIKTYVDSKCGLSCLKTIYFVLYDQNSINTYISELMRYN